MTAFTEFRESVLASLTSAGFIGATAIRHSGTMVLASVPATRRAWAKTALTKFRALPLEDVGGRARYAVFPEPENDEPYSRVVYFRVTGPGLNPQYEGRELCHTVRIVSGTITESDIPAELATALFGTPERADDIAVTRLA